MKNFKLIIGIILLLSSCTPQEGQTWKHKSSNGYDGNVEILEIKENWVRFKSTKNDVIVEMKISEFEKTYISTCGCGDSEEENDQNPFKNNNGEQNQKEYETSDNIEVL